MIKFLIGTRAELIKIFPIIKELDKLRREYLIISTGQHNINYLLKVFNIDKERVLYLNSPKEGFLLSITRALRFCSHSVIKIKKHQIINSKDLIVVHGDTLSTVIATVGTKLRGCKVVHLEAGLRSWDLFEPFPEEISRNVVDFLSDILITVSKESYKNIRKQFPWKRNVYMIGNTIIDAALYAFNYNLEVELPKEDYAIVSIHRHENLTKKWRLMRIVKIIKEASKMIRLYIFMYKNTKLALQRFGLYKYLRNNKNIVIMRPLDYIRFIKWLANAKLLLTDGGSIQEESIVFRVPSIILRLKTERTEGLKTGLNYLSKLKVDPTISKIRGFLNGEYPKKVKNPYGKPGLTKKIVKILLSYDKSSSRVN